MSQKRKRSDIDSSDEEEPALGKQVLPVANLPADFNGEPQDGLQYLFTVRRDSRRLPHVTRAVNPYEESEPVIKQAAASTSSNVNSQLPCDEWRETFLKRFGNFRKNSAQPTIHIDLPSAHKLIPDRKDRDAWWAFLTGCPENEWNPPKKPKVQKAKTRYQTYGWGMRGYEPSSILPYEDTQQPDFAPDMSMVSEYEVEQVIAMSTAESLPTPSITSAPSDVQLIVEEVRDTTVETVAQHRPPEPTPTLVHHMDHRFSLHILMYFAHWISLYLEQPTPRKCNITESHARWMFVLLSRVDDYISADEQSTLRSLARGCMSLIKERISSTVPAQEESNSSEEPATIGIASCWMIVAAVAGVWGQKDLWMDAEAMLASTAE